MEKSSRSFLAQARAAVALAVVTAVTAVALVSAPLAHAASLGFQAQPQPGSPNAELGYFKFDAAAGSTVQRVLVVTNQTDKVKVLRVAACDGLSALYGGVAYSSSTKAPKGVGTWIQLPVAKISVPAKSSVNVPFAIAVPADVTSGVHLGGIALWEPAAATTNAGSKSGSKASTQITMVTRMVMSVVVTTPGPAVPDLKITGVTPQARPDGMYMLVALSSDGTAPASGNGTITMTGQNFQKSINLGAMVPQSGTSYPVLWKADPAAGTYPVEVAIHYDNDTKVASWSGNLNVSGSALKDLTDRYVGPAGNSAGGSTPWLMYALVGGLALIVLFMGFLLLRRRRPEAQRS